MEAPEAARWLLTWAQHSQTRTRPILGSIDPCPGCPGTLTANLLSELRRWSSGAAPWASTPLTLGRQALRHNQVDLSVNGAGETRYQCPPVTVSPGNGRRILKLNVPYLDGPQRERFSISFASRSRSSCLGRGRATPLLKN